MLNTQSVLIAVTEASQVGEARRVALALADDAGLSERQRGAVGIVVTEAAENLVRHSQGGEIVLRRVSREAAPGQKQQTQGVEMLALDRGPGIADLARSFGDGYSTAGTPGNGLGAIARLSGEWDVHSAPGVGTALWARVWEGDTPRPQPPPIAGSLEVGAVCLPISGETECGDAWAVQGAQGMHRIILADGLGHGPGAAQASAAALALFQSSSDSLEASMTAMHAGMRHTRGAAVAVLELEPDQVRFVGVGNIAGAIASGDTARSMVSHNGTVGHQLRRLHEFTYPWGPDALLVLHSDGLTSQWRLDRYPGLVSRHPAVIAGVLYRDFCRGRDDVTVLVLRHPGGGAGSESRPA